jgi:hypothetical protein
MVREAKTADRKGAKTKKKPQKFFLLNIRYRYISYTTKKSTTIPSTLATRSRSHDGLPGAPTVVYSLSPSGFACLHARKSMISRPTHSCFVSPSLRFCKEIQDAACNAQSRPLRLHCVRAINAPSGPPST